MALPRAHCQGYEVAQRSKGIERVFGTLEKDTLDQLQFFEDETSDEKRSCAMGHNTTGRMAIRSSVDSPFWLKHYQDQPSFDRYVTINIH